VENSSAYLQAVNLSHTYGSNQVLAPFELTVQPGEIVAVRGPNGSGKSTLLLCLSGLLRPSTGDVSVCGHDIYASETAAKRNLAFVPDVPRFYLELTAWEHLRFVALAHDAEDDFEARAEALLTEFGLWGVRDQFPHNFSRGMRLKLGLLLAFIRPFKMLLLDEPTSALDADATQLVRDHLVAKRAEGASCLLVTHDPELSGSLADRTMWLADGQFTASTA
jgi:ABC-2 type transport system ATP-binding protein